MARSLIEDCRGRRLKLATAESCTGGLIAACLTDVPGASEVFLGGFVTYANEMKMSELGVAEALLRDFGAVSEQVARAMAEGAVAQSGADVAVSITGIAGPGGGSEEKPVGYVCCDPRLAGGSGIDLHNEYPVLFARAVAQAAVEQAAGEVADLLRVVDPDRERGRAAADREVGIAELRGDSARGLATLLQRRRDLGHL